jgi:hypothetical protein
MEFTGVRKKMVDLLADGLPHTRHELHACLSDELGPMKNISAHLAFIRKKLRTIGEDILCEFVARRMHYRRVRLLPSPNNGKR